MGSAQDFVGRPFLMEIILFHHWLSKHPNIGFYVTIFSVIMLAASLFSKDFRTFMVVQWFTFAIESSKAAVQAVVKLIGLIFFLPVESLQDHDGLSFHLIFPYQRRSQAHPESTS